MKRLREFAPLLGLLAIIITGIALCCLPLLFR
jgi:hypothetical protein